jgi:ABC-type phosphate transport system substrate-binding protein
MRQFIIIAAISGAALTLAACGGGEDTADAGTETAETAETPAPGGPVSAGLWQQTISISGAGSSTIRTCVAEPQEGEEAGPPVMMDQSGCENVEQSRGADGTWSYSATCDRGTGGVVATRGTISGDMSSAYVMEMEITTTGAALDQMNGTQNGRIEAEFLGEDCGDLRPGAFETEMGVIDFSGMTPER